MTYKTQHNTLIFGKQDYKLSDYEIDALSNMPLTNLLGVYSGISQEDLENVIPSDEYKLKNWTIDPLIDYDNLEDISVLTYLEDLMAEDRLALFGSSKLIDDKGTRWAGETAHYIEPDNIMPNLINTSLPTDSIFVTQGQDMTLKNTPEFQLNTLLHELGHIHKLGNEHMEHFKDDDDTQDVYDAHLDQFIKNFVD